MFSLRAGKITKQHKNQVRKVGSERIVRGGIIFGANAAGKSNLLKALALVERMMTENSCTVLAGKQFALHGNVASEMFFSIDYEWYNQIFRYEVMTDGLSITHERLDLLDGNKCEMLFDRTELELSLGERLRGYSWYEQRTFKKESLYLMKLLEDGLWDRRTELPESKLMLNACKGMKQFVVIDSSTPSLLAEKYYAKLQKEEYKDFLVRLLHWADMGIIDVGYRKLPTQEADLIIHKFQGNISGEPMDGWSKVLYDHPAFYLLICDNGVINVCEICCVHSGGRQLRAKDESQGTIKLIQLSSLLFQLKGSRIVWLVDEFDSQLHTVINQALVKWYMAEPCVQSQFIITAHDTNLLTHDIWRTDEVWFVEKDEGGNSQVKSLYSFSPRFDKKLAKGYLSKSYGALPNVGVLVP